MNSQSNTLPTSGEDIQKPIEIRDKVDTPLQVESILEEQGYDRNKLKKVIQKMFELGIQNDEHVGDYGVFDKYIEKDQHNSISINKNTLNSKINKYFDIHFDNIEKSILKHITPNSPESEVRATIVTILQVYVKIIFVYSEKILLGDLEKELTLWNPRLEQNYHTLTQNLNKIHAEEEILHKELPETQKIASILEKEKFFTPFISSHYRNIFVRALEKSNNTNEKQENLIEIVKELIETSLYKELIASYSIFETWLESEGKVNKNLWLLDAMSAKIFEAMKIYKKCGIAFVEPQYNLSDDKAFFKAIVGRLEADLGINTKHQLFYDFMGLAIKKGKHKYTSKPSYIASVKRYKKKRAIASLPPKEEHTEIPCIQSPEFSNWIEQIDFTHWTKIKESGKYKIVFNKILSNGKGELRFGNPLKIKLTENPEILRIFASTIKTEEEDIEKKIQILEQQFEEIKNLEKNGTSLEDFIVNDINNLNVLVLWWRFILKIQELKNNDEEITIEKIKKIPEYRYGVIEKISERLKAKGILGGEKLEIKTKGKVKNTSGNNIPGQISALYDNFKKQHIDLSEARIPVIWENNKGKNVYVKNLTKLYIPSGDFSQHTLKDLQKWLNIGTNICFKILQGIKEYSKEETTYLGYLEQYGIIKNGKEIDMKDRIRVQKLLPVLKYIKRRQCTLDEMHKDAKKDKEVIKDILKGHDLEERIGPKKDLYRSFEKLIKEYNGDYTKLGDLTRFRIERQGIEEVIDAVVSFIEIAHQSKNITHIAIVDKTGEPISLPQLQSGYRDIKLLLNMENSGAIEAQFLYTDMLKMKEKGLDIAEENDEKLFLRIAKKLQKEGKLLNNEDLEVFLDICHEKVINEELLKVFNIDYLEMLCDTSGKNTLMEYDISSQETDNFSTDYSYNIIRTIDKKTGLRKKMTRLERILADTAWSHIVLEYLKGQNVALRP